MITSEKIDQIAVALSKAQAVMEGAKKTSTNPFFHSRYADLAEVWDTCRKPLTDNGLCVIQSISSAGIGLQEGKRCLNLTVTSRLLHISEQWFEDSITMPVEADPQSLGKVTTYIRRYALMALVGIAPEDDDGESAAKHEKQQPEIQGHWCVEHKTVFFKRGNMKSFAHPIGNTGKWCHERKDENEPTFSNTPESSQDTQETAQKPKAVEPDNPIDLDWLKESLQELQWADVAGYLKKKYNAPGVTVSEKVKALTLEQAKEFVAEVEERLKG